MDSRKFVGSNRNTNLPESASEVGLAWCSKLLDENQQSSRKPESASGVVTKSSTSVSGVYWSSEWLDDNRLRVNVIVPGKNDVDDDPDTDPFDPDWHIIVAEILVDYLQHHGLAPKGNWKVHEILSAQRVAYPQQYEYHMFFTIVDYPHGSQHNVFGQVEISRASLRKFFAEIFPEIHCCVIIPESHGYERGCRICRAWVTHPKLVKKFPRAPGVEMWPRRSYITKDVQRFCPKEISHTIFHKKDYGGKDIDVVASFSS